MSFAAIDNLFANRHLTKSGLVSSDDVKSNTSIRVDNELTASTQLHSDCTARKWSGEVLDCDDMTIE